MKRLILSVFYSLLSAPLAFAILDTNNNGLSDIWERQHNDNQVFPETFLAQADDDHDGWSNALEASAGTNPVDANAPAGMVRPTVVHIPAVYGDPDENGIPIIITPEAQTVTWPTIAGKLYTLQFSPDLGAGNWIALDDPFIGNGVEIEYGIPLTQPDGSTPDKLFWRVAINDFDTDNDGLFDAEEFALGLNPLIPQSVPGIPDAWLAKNFTDPLMTAGVSAVNPNADPDGDGASTIEELQNSTDPNATNSPSSRRWVTVHGNGAQQEAVTRTGALTIPAGQSAILIVAIASEEFPEWTEIQSEYNDLLEWHAIPSQGDPIDGSISVNERHAEWEMDVANGTTLPGLPSPVHIEKIQSLTAPDDQDLTISTSVSATNFSDGTLPSDVAVGLLPLEIVSRDKFLAGTIYIPEGWEDLEIEFGGPQNLGRYGGLLEGGSTTIFDGIDSLLACTAEDQPVDQKVWFVRDSGDPRKIRFYTCYSTLGTAEIKLHLNPGVSNAPISIPHVLTEAPDFASVISYVDRWIKGSSFTGEWANTTWMAMNTSEIVGEISNQARACIIPFFDVIGQVSGFTPMVMGVCDGARMGFHDDKEFLSLLANGLVNSTGWVYNSAIAEVTRWSDDPKYRFEQLKTMLADLCQKTVLPYLSDLGQKYTTWEGFRNLAWKAWRFIPESNQQILVVEFSAIIHLATAAMAWADDFSVRMVAGAEKTAFDATPWDNSPLLDEIETIRHQAYYNFGYTLGYCGEQCATAALGTAAAKISQVCLKSGISLVGKLAPRAMAVCAMRLNFLKEALIGLNLADDGLRLAYEGAMTSAARQPTSALIKEVPASLMENRMAAQGFDRAAFNFKQWVKTAMPDGNVRKLIQSPAGKEILSKRTSQLMHLLGDQCDAATMKNFMKVAEERVIVVHPDGTVDEFFEGFFRAFEGNSSLANNLDDPMHSIASLSEGAKARLKFFLSDPDAGALWKLDDPVFVDGVPQIPQNYFTRGVLGELDVFNRVYKKQGYTHAPSAEGYDIFGPKWVQVKTTANPSSSGNIQAMRNAVDALVDKAPPGSALKLHILKKPGTDSAALDAALDSYIDTPALRARVEILIEAYNIGPQ